MNDRSREKLGKYDKGIIMYRRMLQQQLAIVEVLRERVAKFEGEQALEESAH